MLKCTNVIDSLSHEGSLIKELAGKSSVEKAEIMIRETTGKVAEFLSKEASDAMRASVTPQIKKTNINVIQKTGIPGQNVWITSYIGGNPEDVLIIIFNDGIPDTPLKTTLNSLTEYGLKPII